MLYERLNAKKVLIICVSFYTTITKDKKFKFAFNFQVKIFKNKQ